MASRAALALTKFGLMDDFIAYLLQFGSLNQRQPDLIASKATPFRSPKTPIFWRLGLANTSTLYEHFGSHCPHSLVG
jgi:hypothetical protein